jgi:hypothetical protein
MSFAWFLTFEAHSLAQVCSKIRPKYNMYFDFEYSSIKEGLNTHFEDIILLAILTVTKFPKCTGYLFQVRSVLFIAGEF